MTLQTTYRVAAILLVLCSCSSALAARARISETDAEVERLDLDAGAHLRSLLETELTVANDNYTYPNTTLDVSIAHPEGCVPWWSKTIRGGDTICPKDCVLSGFKGGYNLGQTAPLNIQLEKGATSRVAPRPLLGAFLNVTGTTRLPNRRDFVVQSTSNYGVEFIQFSGNYDVGAKFTAFMGLVKKDPSAGGQAVADPKAKHDPYCYFNVTWLIVPAGSTPPGAAGAPAAAAKPGAPSTAPGAADPFNLR